MRKIIAVALFSIGLIALAFVVSNSPQFLGKAAPSESAAVSTLPGTAREPARVPNPSGLVTLKESELPAEGRNTLVLIRQGGPYPYDRDGVTFGNFERILPKKQAGYYKEYTVITPGESDRGARRIVAGTAGEKYYTADHYDSFKFIIEGK